MSKLTDLNNLDRAIKDHDIRLRTAQTSLIALEREISVYEILQSQLQDNIEVLRKKHIIAIATEYRKAKEELKVVNTRLILLCNDRENIRKAIKQIEQFLEKFKEEYGKLLKAMENNVLRGNFRRKSNE